MLSVVPLLLATALASFPAQVASFVSPDPLSTVVAHGTHGPAAALNAFSQPSSSHPNDTVFDHYSDDSKRRAFLRAALVAPLAVAALATPRSAAAADERPPPIIPLQTTARRLRAVPTFTIVDGEGVPFLSYDKDSAGGFGYFFTTYASAEYVLEDAQKAFAKAKTEAAAAKAAEDAGGAAGGAIGADGAGEVPDAWGRARIVSLPLDVVLQLSVKKTRSVAVNGKGREFSTFYQVMPDTDDLNAALRIENGPRYGERGRVPLFYVDGLTLPPAATATEDAGAVGAAERNPVYFRVGDLRDEWQRQHPGTDLPAVKVRELNETFRAMIRPGAGRPDESVRNLVFVPIPESVERAKAAGRSYKLGEMILTK